MLQFNSQCIINITNNCVNSSTINSSVRCTAVVVQVKVDSVQHSAGSTVQGDDVSNTCTAVAKVVETCSMARSAQTACCHQPRFQASDLDHYEGRTGQVPSGAAPGWHHHGGCSIQRQSGGRSGLLATCPHHSLYQSWHCTGVVPQYSPDFPSSLPSSAACLCCSPSYLERRHSGGEP